MIGASPIDTPPPTYTFAAQMRRDRSSTPRLLDTLYNEADAMLPCAVQCDSILIRKQYYRKNDSADDCWHHAASAPPFEAAGDIVGFNHQGVIALRRCCLKVHRDISLATTLPTTLPLLRPVPHPRDPSRTPLDPGCICRRTAANPRTPCPPRSSPLKPLRPQWRTTMRRC